MAATLDVDLVLVPRYAMAYHAAVAPNNAPTGMLVLGFDRALEPQLASLVNFGRVAPNGAGKVLYVNLRLDYEFAGHPEWLMKHHLLEDTLRGLPASVVEMRIFVTAGPRAGGNRHGGGEMSEADVHGMARVRRDGMAACLNRLLKCLRDVAPLATMYFVHPLFLANLEMDLGRASEYVGMDHLATIEEGHGHLAVQRARDNVGRLATTRERVGLAAEMWPRVQRAVVAKAEEAEKGQNAAVVDQLFELTSDCLDALYRLEAAATEARPQRDAA